MDAHSPPPYHQAMHEDDDELHDDPEAPDPADRNDDPAEVPCPYCKRQIDEDAEQCPFCGAWLSAEDAPQSRPWWWAVALVLLVLLVLGYLWR